MRAELPNEAPGRGAPYPEWDKTAHERGVILGRPGALRVVGSRVGHRVGQIRGFQPTRAVGGVLRRPGREHGGPVLRDAGTSYAVWVGIGTVLTVGYSMATGQEPVSTLKVLFPIMIVSGVVGLKLVH